MEYKFRIWEKQSKRMLEYTATPYNTVCLAISENNAIFQMWTGWVDKNGKEIYEGDILRFHKKIHRRLEQVEYCGTAFGVFLYDSKKRTDGGFQVLDEFHSNTLTVVGNMFETPELLYK